MDTQQRIASNIILKLIFVLHVATLTLQQESCTLPDGRRQSTCIRAHYCDYIANLIKQYSGRPPQSVQDTIKSYFCPTRGYVCCPDNALPVNEINSQDDLPLRLTNLNSIRNHARIGLINERNCGVSTAKRIINGDDAEVKEYPWAALLGYDEFSEIKWKCGGSLISSQFVLTAAHCIKKSLSIARLGERQISTEIDCTDLNGCADPVQDIMIMNKIKHPNYRTAAGQKNDIAILKLARQVDMTKNNVKTICLPLTPESDLEKVKERNFVITGWGLLSSGIKSDILQRAYVPFVTNDDCKRKFARHENIKIYHTYLCAGGHNKTDTCSGDSGGGISTYTNFGNTVLYGVVSGGIRCLESNVIYPGIYTDVRYYLDWILDNMS